ncbi:MAG: hypothetical protein RMK19_05185 [Bacteroidia bacterium]|nr:hypothetical protein [Bacteroidia bacterium]MDW8015386.1 hypothetical protein [Bacteroidia bacterium]
MREARLAPQSLWAVIRMLSATERRRVSWYLRGKRLKWLFHTLLHMEAYSESELYRAYRKAFPKSSPHLLRTYKQRLWKAVLEAIPSSGNPIIGQEVEVWQLFWLSVLLWHRGRADLAQALWQRAMIQAVQMGWYETVLWGLCLLEIHERDLHKMAEKEDLHSWIQQAITLVNQRYTAIDRKVALLQKFFPSRLPHGWSLPALPSLDRWAVAIERYADYTQQLFEEQEEASLISICSALSAIESYASFPKTYLRLSRLYYYTLLGQGLFRIKLWNFF